MDGANQDTEVQQQSATIQPPTIEDEIASALATEKTLEDRVAALEAKADNAAAASLDDKIAAITALLDRHGIRAAE